MAKEILRYYRQELSNDTAANPLPSFVDAITAEQTYLSSPQYEKDKVYWDATFAEKPQLCRIKDIKEQRNSRTERYTYAIDEDEQVLGPLVFFY